MTILILVLELYSHVVMQQNISQCSAGENNFSAMIFKLLVNFKAGIKEKRFLLLETQVARKKKV